VGCVAAGPHRRSSGRGRPNAAVAGHYQDARKLTLDGLLRPAVPNEFARLVRCRALAALAPLCRAIESCEPAPGDVDSQRDVLVVGQGGLPRRQPLGVEPAATALGRAAGDAVPAEHWGAVKAMIESMPTATERETAHAARARWLFSLLYIGALGVSEICVTTMAGFFVRRGAGAAERWWLEVTGKDSKVRLVPVTAELLAELIRYRQQLGHAADRAMRRRVPIGLFAQPQRGPFSPNPRSGRKPGRARWPVWPAASPPHGRPQGVPGRRSRPRCRWWKHNRTRPKAKCTSSFNCVDCTFCGKPNKEGGWRQSVYAL
jgi:hypothetical protein